MSVLLPRKPIEQTIFLIRGHQVMLDADLAKLYGVTTFNLNKAVKRNSDRFPEDFMFRLSAQETAALTFQIGISKPRGGEEVAETRPTYSRNRASRCCPASFPLSAIGLATRGELVYIHECVYVGHPEGDRQLREAWRPVRRSGYCLWRFQRSGLARRCTFAPGTAVQATRPIGEQAVVALGVYHTEDGT